MKIRLFTVRLVILTLMLALLSAPLLGGCGSASPGGGLLTGGDLMTGVKAAERPATPTEPGQAFIDSVGQFSWNLFQKAAASKGNPVLSPASVYLALAMTLNGADGATRTAMLKTLAAEALSLADLNGACRDWATLLVNSGDGKSVKIANSIWYNKGFSIDPAFLQVNADAFGATARQLAFDDANTVREINDWVSKATEGKIKDIMERTSSTDVMYLINAVYLNLLWRDQFQSYLTKSGDFFTESGATVRVSYMNRKAPEIVISSKGLSGVLLPYMNERFSFIAILPPAGTSVREAVGSLTAADFQKLPGTVSQRTVQLSLPKYELDYEISLKDPLAALGLGPAMSADADFSLMVKNRARGLFISGVQQKVYFRADEKGTEAAAVTSVTMAASMPPAETDKLVFDRPFLFGILDRKSGLPLFLGIVDNPNG